MTTTRGLIGSRLELLRHSMLYSGANLAGVVAAAGATATAAVLLGPDRFGLLATMQLVVLGASLLRLGVCNAAAREIPALLAQGRNDEVEALQNVSFFSEMLAALLVGGLLAGVAVLWPGAVAFRWLLLIVAAGHLVTTAQAYLIVLHWAHARYTQISQNVILLRLLTAALTVAGAWAIGAAGVLLAPALAAAAVVMSYLFFAPDLRLRLVPDTRVFARLVQRGIPLASGLAAFNLSRQVERFVLATTVSAHDMGVYVFAASLIVLGQGMITDFGSVVEVPMNRHLGPGADPTRVIAEVAALGRSLVLAAAVGASLVQIAFGPLVLAWFPAYSGSAAPLEVLAITFVSSAVSVVPTLLLRSPAVDRLYALIGVQVALVLLQVTAVLFALTLWPHSLAAAAWAVVCAQCTVAAGLQWLLGRACPSARFDWPSIVPPVLCLAAVATLAALFRLPAFVPPAHGAIAAIGARLLGAAGVWAVAALLLFGFKAPPLVPAWPESRVG